MIDASAFVEQARKDGFGLSTSVSCAHLEALVQASSQDLVHVEAANEGDAVAICCGAHLAGTRSIAFIQNSGLGNAVNPLTSLAMTFKIPLLLVISWRGEPGTGDEPQHRGMGEMTTPLLDLMGIGWEIVDESDQLEGAFARATAAIESRSEPYAFIVRRGGVVKGSGKPAREVPVRQRGVVEQGSGESRSRIEMLRAIVGATPVDDWSLVATTGYTGRELFTVADRPNHLYMVGSMGCALPLGLGIALARDDRRVVVLDGDGALLMRMGAMSTAGSYGRGNLVHVLLDNGVHLSTGAQPTTSTNVDWPGLALASGYPKVISSPTLDELEGILTNITDDTFIHVPVQARIEPDLPRPTIGPSEVAARLRAQLTGARA